MNTNEITESLTTLCSELVNGAGEGGGAYILNSGAFGRSCDTWYLAATLPAFWTAR